MKQKISQLMFEKYVNFQRPLPEYNPAATVEWIRKHSGLPWLRLNVNVPHKSILEEIQKVNHLLVPHRDSYNEHRGWQSFCIHGTGYADTQYQEDTDLYYHWTDEAESLMPFTVNYFKNCWPSLGYHRLRIMLLEPGGYITIHKDQDRACLNPINIAITQPDYCNFVMENHGTVPFAPGTAYWLDISNRHVVFNNSNQPRWHIIVHQTNFDHPDFGNMVVNSYKNLYNK
jgi:hypothetical protein